MKKLLITFFALFTALFTSLSAASSDELILECAHAYKNVLRFNEIPAYELTSVSNAIIVIPRFYKGGLLLGGAGGKGVMIEKKDGAWIPSGVNSGSASIGAQIGYEKNILVLYIINSAIVEQIKSSKFTLSAEIAASFGNKGSSLNKLSEVNFSGAIYAYSNNSGLFAGTSLGGAVISANNESFSTASYGFNELINALGNN